MHSIPLPRLHQLPEGVTVLLWPEGSPVVVDNRGFARLDQLAPSMTRAKSRKPDAPSASRDDQKVDLTEYRSLIKKLYQPRLNLRTQQVEVNGTEICEAEFQELHIDALEKHGLRFAKGDFRDVLLACAWRSAYDPVATYIKGLGVEGGPVLSDEDWDQIAVLTLGLGDSWSRIVLQKFLLAAVARVVDPGCKVDQCLILYGKQGLGKSTFFKALGGDFFSDSMRDLNHIKDDLLILHRNWINEWSEADQIFAGAKASEAIKRFVSAQEDCFRVPYGKTAQAFKRRSILCGTTNRDDWAKDPTGNRRFPILSPTEINTDWITENRDKIWARATVELRKGARWWFDKEEEALISLQAANFSPEDPHADLMLEQLRACPGRWFSTQEVAMLALGWDKDKVNKANLNAAARSLHAIQDPCVQSDRRTHTPVNPSHGLKGTKKVWAYIPAQHASTQ